jgi:NitT/TauT family transport system permease protein
LSQPSASTLSAPRSPGLFATRPEAVLVPAVFVVVIILWELSVWLFTIPIYLIPAPSAIGKALWVGLHEPLTSPQGFYLHAGYTILESLIGFAAGSGLGIVLGALMAQFALLEKTVLPYVVAFQSLPKVAIAPLFVIWFGFGIESKAVIAALISFFPLLINTSVGLKSVEQDRIDLLRSLAATRWQIFRIVKVPSALPFIFAGLDMAIIYSLLGAVVGEFVGGQRGLGVVILQLNFNMDIAGVFATLAILAVIGIAMDISIRWIERRTVFWVRREERIIGA